MPHDALFPSPQREHPRVPADFVVKLLSGTRSVLTRALDVSLAGLALHDPAGELRAGDAYRVALRIPGESRDLNLRAHLARRTGDTAALAFSSLDWDDLFTLARYLSPRL